MSSSHLTSYFDTLTQARPKYDRGTLKSRKGGRTCRRQALLSLAAGLDRVRVRWAQFGEAIGCLCFSCAQPVRDLRAVPVCFGLTRSCLAIPSGAGARGLLSGWTDKVRRGGRVV